MKVNLYTRVGDIPIEVYSSCSYNRVWCDNVSIINMDSYEDDGFCSTVCGTCKLRRFDSMFMIDGEERLVLKMVSDIL